MLSKMLALMDSASIHPQMEARMTRIEDDKDGVMFTIILQQQLKLLCHGTT